VRGAAPDLFRYAGWCGLVASVGFGVAAPVAVRRLGSRVGTWLLTVGAVAAAVTPLAVFALMLAPFVGLDDGVADTLHLSPRRLVGGSPVHGPIAVLLVAVVLAMLVRGVAAARQRQRMLSGSRRLTAAVAGQAVGGVVIVPDDRVEALAMPGRPGCIVLTRGLVRSLGPRERRAVLAHERAHLDARHHAHTTVAAIAAAMNPALVRLPAAVSYAVERWADDEAVRATDGATVASALRKVARRSVLPPFIRPADAVADDGASSGRGIVVSSFTGGAVDGRLQALTGAAPRGRAAATLLTVALVVLAVAAVCVEAGRTVALFRLAEIGRHVVTAPCLSLEHVIGACRPR
jgi:Zn-dependent protease with chaperone function